MRRTFLYLILWVNIEETWPFLVFVASKYNNYEILLNYISKDSNI